MTICRADGRGRSLGCGFLPRLGFASFLSQPNDECQNFELSGAINDHTIEPPRPRHQPSTDHGRPDQACEPLAGLPHRRADALGSRQASLSTRQRGETGPLTPLWRRLASRNRFARPQTAAHRVPRPARRTCRLTDAGPVPIYPTPSAPRPSASAPPSRRSHLGRWVRIELPGGPGSHCRWQQRSLR